MMFRRQPPAGGEHLTPYEQKRLRKMQQGNSLDRQFAAMQIRDKGSAAAFVAVLGHARLDADWREIMTRMAVREKDAAYIEAIAPVIAMMRPEAQGGLLAEAQEMDDAKRTAVLAAAANPQSWAAALYDALKEDADAPLRALCIEQLQAGNLQVHYRGAGLMIKALRHMRTDVVEALLPQFSFALYRDEIEKALLTAADISPEARTYFEGLCRRMQTATPAAVSDGDWRRLDADSVAQVTPLPDGGSLTMVFNFATRQQVVLHQPAQGAAAAPVVVPFSQVEGEALQKAASLLPAGETPRLPPAPMLKLGTPHV